MKKKGFPMTVPRSDKGSILIGVLWALFFLSALSVAVNAYVAPQLSFVERLKDKVISDFCASAGVKSAIAEIASFKEEDDFAFFKKDLANNEEIFKDIVVGDGSFSLTHIFQDNYGEEQIRYGLIDEQSKININKAPKIVLENLFSAIGGASQLEAEAIAASIVDWRDEDDNLEEDGAETSYYMTLEDPYKCKNADFAVKEELLQVKGVTQDFFNKVKDFVTVYGDGKLNINTASFETFEAFGLSRSLAEKIVLARRGSDGKDLTADDLLMVSSSNNMQTLSRLINPVGEEKKELFQFVNSEFLGFSSDNFMGISQGIVEGKKVSTKIVFVCDRDRVIKYWNEE